jgi:uncharacterized protein (TIGR03435 family)
MRGTLQITLHHIRKDFAVYDMVVAKSGLKLKESSVDLNAPNTYRRDVSGPLKRDTDGFPILPEGNFKYEAGMQSDGQTRQTWRGWSLPDIADMIMNRMGPSMRVVDKPYSSLRGPRRPPARSPVMASMPPGYCEQSHAGPLADKTL